MVEYKCRNLQPIYYTQNDYVSYMNIDGKTYLLLELFLGGRYDEETRREKDERTC
jgi:hypothetical protein